MEVVSEPRGIHRRIVFEVTPSLRVRFNAKVDRSEPTGCWPWVGAQRNGYGAIKHDGKVLGTHVVAFLAAGGKLAEGQLVTHDCDNRLCCNPSHLRAGTNQSNAREAWDRRSVNATRGEAAPHAVLTDVDVRLILAIRVAKGWGELRISQALNRNKGTVRGVITRRTWRHIPVPTVEEATSLLQNPQ